MSDAQSALPTGGVPATGLFQPVVNIVPNTYNISTGDSDAPYNQTLIGDSSSNLVGTATKPYIQMALPTYIPTLYSNVYDIQTNLKDEIPLETSVNNREYPTSYAVKQYVASQVFGSETLVPVAGTTPLVISTGLTTTALVANTVEGSPNVSLNGNVYTTHFDINDIDPTRSGASKNVVCITDLGLDASTNVVLVLKVELGLDKYFVVNGQFYNTYEFVSMGDSLTMIQFLSSTADPDIQQSLFFVTNYGGVFYNRVL
jgi:hypothetical protein